MRSRTKLKLTGKTKDGFYPHFAWWPVRIYVPIIDPNDEDDRAWITAWLETVECKSLHNFPAAEKIYRQSCRGYVYRFPEARKDLS